MELLGIRQDKNFIQLVDFTGKRKSLQLLARYAAEPVIGQDYGTWVALDRPLTRFLILTDAEEEYATPKKRRYQRKLLLDSLTVNIPPDLRRDLYTNRRRDRLVEIKTWVRSHLNLRTSRTSSWPMQYRAFRGLRTPVAVLVL